MMENAKLPFRTWYLAMAFMSFSKKGISARELQTQLGHSRYKSIWSMMHRIKQAMGQRDNLYILEDMVKLDEGYFTTETSKCDKQNLKRGRGSQKQVNVAVMAKSIPLEDYESGEVKKQCRYFKMKVLGSHRSEAINEVVEKKK